jgi:hypothetical protein
MNDQLPTNAPLDRYEARRQRRGSTWVAGLIMIMLGVAFLMRTTGNFDFPVNNWWALFILIPAVGAFDTVIRMYRNANNQLTAPAGGSLIVGLVLTFVTASFLFNLNWSLFGPVILILAGIGILATAMLGRDLEILTIDWALFSWAFLQRSCS